MASSELQNELAAFHRFIGQQLGDDNSHPSPEECLELWRKLHPRPDELKESVAAVKRALDQADRGEGKSVEDFDRGFRERHGISQDA